MLSSGTFLFFSRAPGWMYFGGRDVETSDYRSDCALRLHSLCNSALAALLTRRICLVVRGHRLSGDWSPPHSNERRGRSSQGRATRLSARLLRVRIWIWDVQSVSLWLWNVPTVQVWVRNVPAI